jgi:hypothetical protein
MKHLSRVSHFQLRTHNFASTTDMKVPTASFCRVCYKFVFTEHVRQLLWNWRQQFVETATLHHRKRLDKTMYRVLSREGGNLNNNASNRTFEYAYWISNVSYTDISVITLSTIQTQNVTPLSDASCSMRQRNQNSIRFGVVCDNLTPPNGQTLDFLVARPVAEKLHWAIPPGIPHIQNNLHKKNCISFWTTHGIEKTDRFDFNLAVSRTT